MSRNIPDIRYVHVVQLQPVREKKVKRQNVLLTCSYLGMFQIIAI